MDGATDRATLQDVPPEWAVRGLFSQLQQVVQNHLANEIMPRESVEVIDTEVQLALCQLGQGYRELKRLVEDGVQRLPVHLRGRGRERYDVHSPCSQNQLAMCPISAPSVQIQPPPSDPGTLPSLLPQTQDTDLSPLSSDIGVLPSALSQTWWTTYTHTVKSAPLP